MAKYVISEEFLQRVERLQSILKNNLAGMFGGNHQAKVLGTSCEFSDYKDYIPGDDTSKIDWNAYARFENLYVKLYQDERRLHNRIYIDVSRSMDYGKKAQRAIEIAATFAYLSVVELDRVSIYTVSGSVVTEVIAGVSSRNQFYEQIEKLNDIQFGGECFISDAILPQQVGYGDGFSVILSDFCTDSDYERAIDYLVDKKRDLVCIQILSQEELNPQVRGKNLFFDSENSAKTYKKNITHDVVSAYKQAVRYVMERLGNYCRMRSGAALAVSDENGVEDIFFRDFVEAEVLK